MKLHENINICVIGAGRVGTTLAAVISKKKLYNLKLVAVYSRHEESLKKASEYIDIKNNKILLTTNLLECSKNSNCIFICTPDDVIEKVCKSLLVENFKNFYGKLFIHFSGAKSLEVLKPAQEAGAFIASVHPLKSFASIDNSIRTIKGTVYGVTFQENCPDFIKNIVYHIIKILGGKIIEIPDKLKSLYHAAACVASNYLVALIDYAVKIHGLVGINPKDSLQSLEDLIEGTIENIKKLGTKKALTGPIARGDIGTIKEHLKSFNKYFDKSDIIVYKVMGLLASQIAYENNWISKKTLQDFKKIFINNSV